MTVMVMLLWKAEKNIWWENFARIGLYWQQHCKKIHYDVFLWNNPLDFVLRNGWKKHKKWMDEKNTHKKWMDEKNIHRKWMDEKNILSQFF